MTLRGERFIVDLSDDDDLENSAGRQRAAANVSGSQPFSFVGDIVERTSTGAKPPAAPSLKSTITGFPEHKKRSKLSTFKTHRSPFGAPESASAVPVAAQSSKSFTQADNSSIRKDYDFEYQEKRQIDEENRQRMAAMSDEEIDQERKELFANLDPDLIQSLLRRANLDDTRSNTVAQELGIGETGNSRIIDDASHPEEAVPMPDPAGKKVIASRKVAFVDEDKEPADPGELKPLSGIPSLAGPKVHFPSGPAAPDLDPTDPNFLENLHTKYFPSLPADPSKLAWMAPIPTNGSIADQESPYYPGHGGLSASALRFDFRGGLLPPRVSRALPTNKGLHHHGEAPEAAGYTLPELARLARSAFPAQRCIAFQTLGRVLYRLGTAEWGHATEIEMGLWKCVEEGKVIETLEAAASAEGGHQGSKAYAVEAVWLWQKGGGKKWKAG